MRILQLTSAHPRSDARIFYKECCSLVKAGHEVHLLVADGLGDSEARGVHIHDVGRPARNRASRMLGATWRIWRRAAKLHPDLVHIHDPELLPVLLAMRFQGARTVYDAHEDLPRQILSKPWIPAWLRPWVSRSVECFENSISMRLDAVVVPTACIRQRFEAQGIRVAEVRNYPIPERFHEPGPWDARKDEICYVGALSRARGLVPLVTAMEGIGVPLNLAGFWNEPGLRELLQSSPGWTAVREWGVLGWSEAAGLMDRCKIGMVTLLPVANYIEALPVKLFEYMAAGMPVIASNFPLWREIVESAGCGLLVDPADPMDLQKAIRYLLSHQDEAKAMGARGRSAVLAKYQWTSQSKSLIDLVNSFGI